MKPSMLAKLDQLAERLEELNSLLAQEDATSSMDNFRKMTREHAELGPLVALYHDYVQASEDIRTAGELLSDPDMKAFAQEEIDGAKDVAKIAAGTDEVDAVLQTKRAAPLPQLVAQLTITHHEQVQVG